MKSILLCIAVLAVLALTKPQAPKAPQPDMIVELFRHGARGPLGTYDLSWPVSEYGMLTPVGLRQQYILGKVLSEKYPDLIGATYNYSNIYMITDTTPRCVQSAGGQLYGMYLGKGPALPTNEYPPELAIPPFKDPRVDVIADSLPDSEALPHNFVPGIIEIVDATSAFIFQGDQSDYCPNQNVWSAINGNDTLFQQAMEVFGETIANVNKLLPENEQLTNQVEIWTFGDTLLVDLYDNRTLPAGINDPQLITNITWAFTWFTYHWWDGQLEQRQTGAFNLIEAILQQLADYRQGNVTTTAALFSGHDDNIFALLGVFGIVNEQCIFDNFASVLENGTLVHPLCYYPYFASDMIFEFYNDTETPYVQVFYNNEIIPICNGQSNCSYDEFVTFARSSVGNLTLESYFKACGTNSTYLKEQFGILNYTFPQPDLSFVMSKNSPIQTEMIAAVVLAIICVMLVTKIVFDKKKYTEELKAARESVLYEKIASF